ncbi:Lsr2 family protein [Nocardia tengchongensis]|uniref:histone-like nucleoid-structuring protein Lsr2 n=1 Tax=Nocardia tengchongensis TaxID=2055889 RepID=UPI0036CF8CE9
MARKVVVSLIDDFDGEAEADETITFALDGVVYEIDLSASNADRLRGDFSVWVSHARRVRGARRKSSSADQRSAEERHRSTTIREWARGQGLQVSTRGRIPGELVAAYRAAVN